MVVVGRGRVDLLEGRTDGEGGRGDDVGNDEWPSSSKPVDKEAEEKKGRESIRCFEDSREKRENAHATELSEKGNDRVDGLEEEGLLAGESHALEDGDAEDDERVCQQEWEGDVG